MSLRNFTALPLLTLTLLATTGTRVQARQEPAPQSDNSKANKTQSPTADDQSANPADREIIKKIRAAIHRDKDLSTYAHNIKIIAQSGKVTLKGPVRSQQEKDTLAAKATTIAGEGNVDNQLEIAPKQ
jgi:hyperosmotically inducible periplasmic protein